MIILSKVNSWSASKLLQISEVPAAEMLEAYANGQEPTLC